MKRIIAFASITFLMTFTMFAVAHAANPDDALNAVQNYYGNNPTLTKTQVVATVSKYYSRLATEEAERRASRVGGHNSLTPTSTVVPTPPAIRVDIAAGAVGPSNLVSGTSVSCGRKPGVDPSEGNVGWECNTRTGQWIKVRYSTPVPPSAIDWDDRTDYQEVCSPSRTGTYPNGERITRSGNPGKYDQAECDRHTEATAAALNNAPIPNYQP